MDELQVYYCTNSSCVLGSRWDKGRFTNGITADQKNLLTGEPVESILESGEYGEGYCPTCGDKGEEATPNEHKRESGVHVVRTDREDPLQDLHDKVAAMVADPGNKSVTTDNAQEQLEALAMERLEKEDIKAITNGRDPEGSVG